MVFVGNAKLYCGCAKTVRCTIFRQVILGQRRAPRIPSGNINNKYTGCATLSNQPFLSHLPHFGQVYYQFEIRYYFESIWRTVFNHSFDIRISSSGSIILQFPKEKAWHLMPIFFFFKRKCLYKNVCLCVNGWD